ncbi:MAG: SAM-dependent methyltransferase [Acidimicrobiia bacterium]|nr:SAM-dependent methyltransferase [Acidimicrobiia bacterium]
MSDFKTVTSVGGLLPSDLLTEIARGSEDLDGTSFESYGLVPGERLNDHITRSWNRLVALWSNFKVQLELLPDSDQTATTLTRDRWLRPLLDELGFAGIPQARAAVIDGKEYAISHQWGPSVPVHVLGIKVPIDRRTPGIPGAAKSSPHGLVQEFINRSDDHLWALLTNGAVLRLLRDNASLTRQAYVEFDLRAIFDGEYYSDFVLLWLTCHRTRFEGDPPEKCLLESWTQHAASTGTRALDRLRDGVESAIESLGEGFLDHHANSDLRSQIRDGTLSTSEFQRQLLRVVYRILFLLVAEARDLLLAPETDEVTRGRYRDFYSVGRLVRLARRRRGSAHDDLWAGLQVTMRALWREGEPKLGLSPLGSFLWAPDSVAALEGASIDNARLLEAIRQLTITRDVEGRVDRNVDYRNLGAEELGSIYESLLELHAQVDVHARRFSLENAAGNERKTTGSYYTPTSLINELLESALDPVLDEAARSTDPEKAILRLSVLDPACGSGHFLIAAANRIARRLASVRAGGIEPSPQDVRGALRDVVGRCLHGIDVNPMAVELCKVSLWLEATEPGKPLSFLDHRIVCGNALLGTTPRLLSDGIPDSAFKPLGGDDRKVVAKLRKRNKSEREGQTVLDLFEESVSTVSRPVADAIAQINAVPDSTVEDVSRKAKLLRDLNRSQEAARARLAADAWCAAFVCQKAVGEPPITTATINRLLDDPTRVPDDVVDRVRELADRYRFLHFHLAFPDVFCVPSDLRAAEIDRAGWSGGFSVVLGNPPWERVKLQEKEFFAEHDSDIAAAPNAASRKRLIRALESDNPELFVRYEAALREADGVSHFLRSSSRYPLCGRGDVNTYSVFAEGMRNSVGLNGRLGVIVPSGIATDDTTKFFFRDVVEKRSLVSLFDFENRKAIFQGVHRSYKFCLLTLSGRQRPVEEVDFVFFALDTADLNDPERRFTLTPEDFALLNPNTRTCPIFRTRHDAEITKGIYRRVPVLIAEGPPEQNPWRVSLSTMFHMSSASHMFRTRDQLESEEWVLRGSTFTRGEECYLPLYEAKMIHHFDHRWATFERDGFRDVMVSEKQDPCFLAMPRYWVPMPDVEEQIKDHQGLLGGWRKICRATDVRTWIYSLFPRYGAGDNILMSLTDENYLLTAVATSFVVDFVCRQKLGGTNLQYYITRQLPVAPISGEFTDHVARAAKELIETSWDISPHPYRWDPDRRESIRTELDAAFFHVYGIDRDEVDYILDSFPIVRRDDENQFGEYRTKRLILENYDRITESNANGEPFEAALDPPPADPSLRHDLSTRPDWAELYFPAGR